MNQVLAVNHPIRLPSVIFLKNYQNCYFINRTKNTRYPSNNDVQTFIRRIVLVCIYPVLSSDLSMTECSIKLVLTCNLLVQRCTILLIYLFDVIDNIFAFDYKIFISLENGLTR